MKLILAAVALIAMATPALAFNCGKASTEVEKLICANPDLVSADDQMAAAYDSRRSELSGNERAVLQASQRGFIRRRENCSGGTETENIDCIRKNILARSALLSGQPLEGDGATGDLRPVFVQREPDKHHYHVEVDVLKFVSPSSKGELVFNAEVDKRLAKMPLGKTDETVPDGIEYAYELGATLNYASPRLISMTLEGYQASGGAHGYGWTEAINVDLKSGRLMSFDDTFSDGASEPLIESCVTQLISQKTERFGTETPFEPKMLDEYQPDIEKIVQKLENWTLSPSGAVVTFDSDVIGSHAEGGYTCNFRHDELAPLLRAGRILPE